jgi:hypothetical protein
VSPSPIHCMKTRLREKELRGHPNTRGNLTEGCGCWEQSRLLGGTPCTGPRGEGDDGGENAPDEYKFRN